MNHDADQDLIYKNFDQDFTALNAPTMRRESRWAYRAVSFYWVILALWLALATTALLVVLSGAVLWAFVYALTHAITAFGA